MSKVRNFSEIAPNIEFPEFNFYELYYSTFEKSELGRIKKLLPLRELAENFGLVRKSMRPKLGRKSFFTPEAERRHPLTDNLRRDNRSDTPIDKL